MKKYVETLGENPSEENLEKIIKEIRSASDVITSFRNLIFSISEKGEVTDYGDKINEYNEVIRREELFIEECKIIEIKITKALSGKSN